MFTYETVSRFQFFLFFLVKNNLHIIKKPTQLMLSGLVLSGIMLFVINLSFLDVTRVVKSDTFPL